MPRVSTEITPRIAELLQAGVITITTSWFESGSETYGRVTQPHPKLGAFPHESFKLDELESFLEKIRVPSLHGAPVESGPVNALATPVKKGNAVSVINRYEPNIGNVPSEIGIHGVRNILPKGSLCWKDLALLNDSQLHRRILSVGKEIGADKAVSRIESMLALHMPRGASTLYEWWVNAEPTQRLTLISNAKLLGKVDEGDKDRLLARLGAGQYPFRGTDRKIQKGKDEEDKEEEEEGLRLDFDDLEIFE